MAPAAILLLQYHSLETIVRLGPVERPPARALRVLLDQRAGGDVGSQRIQSSDGVALRPLRRHHPVGGLPQSDGRRGPRRLGGCALVGGRLPGSSRSRSSPLAAGPGGGPRTRAPRLARTAAETMEECVIGYGAASRAVALLCKAEVDRRLLPAVVDSSTAKHGLRMPGTDIPIVGPATLAQPGRTTFSCSYPICSPRSAGPFPRSKRAVADGWMPKRCAASRATPLRSAASRLPLTGASMSASISRRWSRQRPLVGPILPIGMLSCSAISLYGRSSSPINRPRRRWQRGDSCSAAIRMAVLLLISEEASVKRVRLVVGDEVHQVVRGDDDLPGGDPAGSHAAKWSPARHPRRSGCSIRSRFSTSRSQVVWQTSATSASLNRHRLAMAATKPPKRPIRASHADAHPIACLGHDQDEVGIVC